jgi:hypothetical protein
MEMKAAGRISATSLAPSLLQAQENGVYHLDGIMNKYR